MAESASSYLGAWSSFYVITGSSAAALTGLMFVVITITMGEERLRRSSDGMAAFSTPIVLHLSVALLVSAVLCAPWHSLVMPGVSIGIAGLYGIVYIVRIVYRTRRLTSYTPDVEDWAWYSVLPLVAYGAVFGGAIALEVVPAKALFAVAGGVLLLIFIGIRNAWDIVTFIAIRGPDDLG
ncbi:MAG: hypothetical protein WA814_03775 [Candidatus Baltobacteraceae bacterium]